MFSKCRVHSIDNALGYISGTQSNEIGWVCFVVVGEVRTRPEPSQNRPFSKCPVRSIDTALGYINGTQSKDIR